MSEFIYKLDELGETFQGFRPFNILNFTPKGVIASVYINGELLNTWELDGEMGPDAVTELKRLYEYMYGTGNMTVVVSRILRYERW